MLVLTLLLLLIQQSKASTSETELKNQLTEMNTELTKVNSITAYLAWGLSVGPSSDLAQKSVKFGEIRTEWRNNWCYKLLKTFDKIYDEHIDNGLEPNWIYNDNNNSEFRQFYLLCRGPKYTLHQARELTNVMGQLQSVYQTAQVCLGDDLCFHGEPDLERMMAKSRDPQVLLWAWVEWRNAVGPPSKIFYPTMVTLLNEGARNNGYNDIGECWREELEVPGLEQQVMELYEEVEDLYKALHAVVRYQLNRHYGKEAVPLNEPIPAHLLGNMWAQSWDSIMDIVIDTQQKDDLTFQLQKKNYTVIDLVKRAEDFYVSLGFKPMTEAFWKHSMFEKKEGNVSTCHGTAANMFRPDDYRILLCAEIDEDDFYVIHHEMGHIEYYMEYSQQPAIFQDGANSAFQEAIGDAIMYGVMSPAHLERLGLTENVDQAPGFDIKFLLHQALSKLPQISFALALEKWRWDVFKGEVSPMNYNKAWWDLRERFQGVRAPVQRTEQHFDPASKFHINDNTPYVRYFLSSILQMQIFESLCKATVFGDVNKEESFPLPLHRCDIYGSKNAAKALRHMMSLGSSVPWQESLQSVVGEPSFSVRPLLEYYKPLHLWLRHEIKQHNIPVGWD